MDRWYVKHVHCARKSRGLVGGLVLQIRELALILASTKLQAVFNTPRVHTSRLGVAVIAVSTQDLFHESVEVQSPAYIYKAIVKGRAVSARARDSLRAWH